MTGKQSLPAGAADRGFPAWLGTLAVYALSLGCLLWVYHDFDWKTELPKLARIHWVWILLAVLCDVLVYFSQAWRWNMLLRPVKEVPFGRSVQAIYIGLFANEVLPLRGGELIRCYLITVWDRVQFPLVLGSALIERLIDGVWLVLGFALVALLADLPNEIEIGGYVLAGVVGAIGALVAFAVLNRRFAHHVTTRHRWSEPLRVIVEGLHTMGRARSFPMAVAASTVYLGLQVIPIHAMIRGYGLDLDWSAACIVLVVLRLGTVVPGAPGNVGLFHLCAFLALNKVLGVDAQTAKSVSGMMFFVVTVPLLAAGAIALALTGGELREIYHAARSHRHGGEAHAAGRAQR